jgi:uncharacterized protein
MEEDKNQILPPINGRLRAVHHLIVGLFLFVGVSIILNFASIYMATLLIGESTTLIKDPNFIQNLTQNPSSLRIILVFGSSLSFVVATWLALIFVKANPWIYTSLNEFGKNDKYFWALGLFLVSIPLIGFLMEWNQIFGECFLSPDLKKWFMEKENENERLFSILLDTKGPQNLLINLVVMALIPAISEEIFFRGFLLKTFHGITKNIHWAILLTSVIFTAVHMQFFKVIPMILLSSILGYLVYWSRSLWPSIFIHALNNSLVVLASYFSGNESLKILEDTYQFPIWAVGISVAGLAGIFLFHQKSKTIKLNNFYE